MIISTLERQSIAGVTDMDNVVVDTSVVKKTIVAGLDFTLYDKSNSQKCWFSYNEGVTITSIYIRMPYQFTLADAPLNLELFAYINGGATYVFPEFGEGGNGTIGCILENYEIQTNVYCAPPPAAVAGALKYKLYGRISATYTGGLAPAVAMIGAPASLNAATLGIPVGVLIKHAYGLTASP